MEQQNSKDMQLDSYSMLIVSKYFHTQQDYVNIICVCKKFEETTEKLRYNPIQIDSLKLFPNIQTQYLYSDRNKIIDGIDNYELWYEIDYDQYLELQDCNYKFHHIKYTKDNRKQYGNEIPNKITVLDMECYGSIFGKMFDDFVKDIHSITINKKYKSIESNCFDCCRDLKNIIFLNQPTKISSFCFCGCHSLTSLNFLSSVQALGNNCFNECFSFTQINLPNSITSIGKKCFIYCTSLQSITFPSSIFLLEEGILQNCELLTSIILPTTLILIGNNCFENCINLKSIELPCTLKQIGNYCFNNCGIESIEIPESVDFIGVDCFYKCSSLTKLTIQSSRSDFLFKVSYSDSLLYKKYGINCPNIILTQNDVKHLINDMRQQHNNSYTCIIPNGVIKIGDFNFCNETNIQSIIIPSSVTSIGNYCFNRCIKLTSISIPTTVKSIGVHCFEKYRRRDKLKELSVPLNNSNKYPFKISYEGYFTMNGLNITCEKVVLFDYFDYDHDLRLFPKNIPLIINTDLYKTEETTISNNIISIKSNHLSTDITTITIPTNVTYLCDECFKNYTNLKSITIPTTLNYLGKHIIDGCISLTDIQYEGDWNNVVVSYDDHLRYKANGLLFSNIEYTKEDTIKYGNIIPSVVHSLNRSYYDRSNEMIHIPNHITSLDNNTFASKLNICSKLRHITIPTSITIIPKHCFSKCYLLTSVSLPSTILSIKKKAFNNCISLESIIIPHSVSEIGQYCFNKCYSLTSITFSPILKLGVIVSNIVII